jgi:hypothetical protein
MMKSWIEPLREKSGIFGFLFWACLLTAALPCGCRTPEGVDPDSEPKVFAGPFHHRSMMPLSLIFASPIPDDTRILPDRENRLSWNTTYASVFVKEERSGDRISVDGEFLRTSLLLERGLGGRVQLGLELPFLYYSSGFLDSLIENFHDAFGFPQGDRDQYPRDQYDVTYIEGGNHFFDAEEDDFSLADIPLYCKVGLVDPEETGFGLAARGILEFPTGDEDKGFGSGKYEGGAGLLAQNSFCPSFAAYMNADYIMRSTPTNFHGTEVADVTHLSLALEKAFTHVFAVVVQTDYQTRPLKDGDLQEFDRPEWNVSFGVGWQTTDRTRLKLFFSEGITTHNTADFAVGMSLGTRF